MPNSPFVSIVRQYTDNHFVLNSISPSSRETYKSYMSLINQFFQEKRLNELEPYEAEDFFIWLRNRPCSATRCSMTVSICKNALDFAVSRKLIAFNPFQYFKPKYSKFREVAPLPENDLEKVINAEAIKKSEIIVKDIYLFQTYTGLSFSDLWSFRIIKIGEKERIYSKRKKTNVEFWVPLLPEAKGILEKYNYNLPKIKYRTFYGAYRRFFAKLNIDRKFHPHDARKNFSNYMYEKKLLSHEALRIMLGHKTTASTIRHYIVASSRSRVEMEWERVGL